MSAAPNRTRPERAVALLLALLTVIGVGALVPAAAATASTIELSGTWRFTVGDDLAWVEPAFDDSGWEQVTAPASFAEIGHASHADDFAWYRRTFEVAAGGTDADWLLEMGPIDDVDATYVNGTLVGTTGGFPDDVDSIWERPRLYPVAGDLLVEGTNTIAVRVYNAGPAGWDGAGGIFLGPLRMLTRPAYRAEVLGLQERAPTPAERALVTDLLATQAAAIAAGDVDAYSATLAADFFHDGHTRDRRAAVVADWLTRGAGLSLVDADVDVAVLTDGTIVADVVRRWAATNGADLGRLAEPNHDVLHVDPATGLERGNHARYYADGVWSEVDDRWWEVQVWLPAAYLSEPTRTFPTTWLLHGVNGGPREWEWRTAMPFTHIADRYDVMFATPDYEPMVIIAVDGEDLSYSDGEGSQWSTMFTTELLPAMEEALRLDRDRSARALTGFSMGGGGVFHNGFGHPELFGSLASHAGVIAEGLAVAATQTPAFLQQFAYYLDSGEDDAFRGDDQIRAMSALLTAKLVEHTMRVVPGGHDPIYLSPALDDSFCAHSRFFRGEDFADCTEVPGPSAAEDVTPAPAPAPTTEPAPDPDPAPLPATGGGLSLLGLAAVAAGTSLRRR